MNVHFDTERPASSSWSDVAIEALPRVYLWPAERRELWRDFLLLSFWMSLCSSRNWRFVVAFDVVQEEEALLNEMEVTGQAFEDMQEQNSRLIQQLREKDDANFKLMSERIKAQQVHKLQREEKDLLVEQVDCAFMLSHHRFMFLAWPNLIQLDRDSPVIFKNPKVSFIT